MILLVDKEIKKVLKPIYIVIEKLVPTNRTLLDFVNEKAVGRGTKRSIYKIKFLDKAEKSSYQVASVTLIEFEKHLKTLQVSKEYEEKILQQANEILDNAKKQIEKTYGEVRRYIVTKELRNDCLKEHFRKIPSMNDAQNAAISQEIFSMAIDAVNKIALIQNTFAIRKDYFADDIHMNRKAVNPVIFSVNNRDILDLTSIRNSAAQRQLPKGMGISEKSAVFHGIIPAQKFGE